MTKYILTLFLTFSIFTVFAQNHSDTLTPGAGERQVTFGLTNNAGFIAFKKHKSEKIAYRFGFGGNYNIQKDPSYIYQNLNLLSQLASEGNKKDFSLYLFSGIQKRIGNYKKLEPYAGMDLRIGTSFSSSYSKTVWSDSNATELKTRSGLTLIAVTQPFLGFNYYLTDRLAIGAEYRVSVINFIWFKGSETEKTTTDKYGTVTYQDIGNPDESGISLRGQFNGSAVITATLFLHKR